MIIPNLIKFCFLTYMILLNGISSTVIEDLSQSSLEEFNYKLEQNDYTLVLFFSSDSNSRAEEAKILNKAAYVQLKKQFRDKKLYKNYDRFLNFMMIDCEGSGLNLCNAYSIVDKPEFALFRFGTLLKRINLDHASNQAKFVNLIQNNIKAISIRFDTFSELNAFLKQSNQPVVLGLFLNIEDRLSIDNWSSSIEKVKLHWNYKDILFCHIFVNYSNGSLNDLEFYTDESFSTKISLPSIAIVKQKEMIHKKEKKVLVYNFSSNKEDLSEWLKRKIFGLIIWRSRDNENDIKLPVVVAYYNFDFKNNYKLSFKWRNLVYDFALKNLDLNFALSSSHTFRRYLDEHELEVDDSEPLFIAYDLFGYGYLYEDIFSEYEFGEYLTMFRKFQLKPLIEKSASYESNNQITDDLIKELNPLTFSKYILNSKKDVFIFLYVNWCSHCKGGQLALEELSQRITKDDDLVFVKMECSQNDLPKQFENIDDFPSYYLFKSSSKELIKCESNRNIVSLISFLAKHTTKELVHFDRFGRFRTPEEQKKFRMNLENIKSNTLNALNIENVKNEL